MLFSEKTASTSCGRRDRKAIETGWDPSSRGAPRDAKPTLAQRLGYGPRERLLIVNCDDLGVSEIFAQGGGVSSSLPGALLEVGRQLGPRMDHLPGGKLDQLRMAIEREHVMPTDGQDGAERLRQRVRLQKFAGREIVDDKAARMQAGPPSDA